MSGPNAEVQYVSAETGAVLFEDRFIDNLMCIRRDRFGIETLRMGYSCGRPLPGVALPIFDKNGKRGGQRVWR